MLRLMFLFAASLFFFVCPVRAQKLPVLGIISGLESDSLLYASGFRLLGTSVSSLIDPSLPEAAFNENLKKVQALQCTLYLCNVLFPASIKIAGPEVNESKVLEHLAAILARAQRAGIKNLVLGSGGARRLPEGYSSEKAATEFVVLAKKMADAAARHNVTILLESLNSTETNFLNKLRDAADIVKRVAHPNFRLNADIYHMMKEGEMPEEIIAAGGLIDYVELAEKDGRTLPGVAGDDFRPYFTALKKINYKGPVVIEAKIDNLRVMAPKAYKYLRKQLQEVYKKS